MTAAGRLQRHLHGTDDSHRVTTLELFFDLVFVYGLTQVTALMAHDTSWTRALDGVITLALLWFAWSAYAWLGNQAKADEGVLRVALVVAMMAVFVVALSIPQAFEAEGDGLPAALVLATGLVVVRVVHVVVYYIAAGDDAGLRRQLVLTAGVVVGWAVLLVAGATTDGGTRAALWIAALAVDYVGIFVSSRAGGWRLTSASHFAERHGLIVLIAIGESIVAIGVGVAELPLTGPVLLAVLLGFTVSVTLWWSYFDVVAPVAERALVRRQGSARADQARDSYTYLHFPMVVGIVFLALGMKKVVGYVADTDHHDLADNLTTVPVVALYGGVALYLAAHLGFRMRNLHSVNRQRLVLAVVLALLIPVARHIPALAALGLLAALMVSLIAYEVTTYGEVRARLRHAEHEV